MQAVRAVLEQVGDAAVVFLWVTAAAGGTAGAAGGAAARLATQVAKDGFVQACGGVGRGLRWGGSELRAVSWSGGWRGSQSRAGYPPTHNTEILGCQPPAPSGGAAVTHHTCGC